MTLSFPWGTFTLLCVFIVISLSDTFNADKNEDGEHSAEMVKVHNNDIEYREAKMLDNPNHTVPVTAVCTPYVNCAFKTYNRFGVISGTSVYCGSCPDGYECTLSGNNLNLCYLWYTCIPAEQNTTESSDNSTKTTPDVEIPEQYANVWPRELNLTEEAESSSPRKGREQDLSNCDDRMNTNEKRKGDVLDFHEL